MYQVYQRQVYQRGTRRNPEKMLGVPELAALVYQFTGLQIRPCLLQADRALNETRTDFHFAQAEKHPSLSSIGQT